MEVKLTKKQKVAVKGAEDIYLIMRQILRRENKIGQGQEHFWMVGLNQANKILYIELVALGSTNIGQWFMTLERLDLAPTLERGSQSNLWGYLRDRPRFFTSRKEREKKTPIFST
ncbi:hypothetical protein [Candidatus Thiosymbion oneisti]|uniref:hypothetical protein n=1 Tax=Candidatus Thiosymbion oneisti TaxID=589554 RepID=UPI001A9C5E38|nr:hypothetical protein [Candidatus Thiosymbion oneisti]